MIGLVVTFACDALLWALLNTQLYVEYYYCISTTASSS